tara:strand:- start:221 stop:1021 length:801 start_codon:yes stop_codon:yes gene_type:complete
MIKNLKSEVSFILQRYNHGTYRSRADKRDLLNKIIKDLLDLKIAPPSFRFLAMEHIEKLVSLWRKQGNSDKTIRNKMATLRFLNDKGNFVIDIPTNDDLNLTQLHHRATVHPKINVAQQVSSPISELIIELQTEFGLTRTEAVRLNPWLNIQKQDMNIPRSISFNRRERFIAIYKPSQKEVIIRLKRILDEKNCLAEMATERHVLNLYNAELAIQGVALTTRFRNTYANNRLAELSRKSMDKESAYQVVMDEMGYKSKRNLMEAIL